MNFDPVFILSTGRCGTLAIQRFFQRSTEIEAFHRYRGRSAEYRNDMSILLEQNYTYYKVIKPDSPDLSLVNQCLKRLEKARRPLIERLKSENKGFMEVNHEFSPFASLLKKAYPNARFVHIIRHPKKVISSFMRKFSPPPMKLPAYFGTMYSLKGQYVLRYGHVKNFHECLPEFLKSKFTIPEFDKHLHPFKKRNGNWVENKTMSAFQKTIWYWEKINRLIMENFADLSDDRTFRIKSESLFSKDMSRLKKFFQWLGPLGKSAKDFAVFLEQRYNPKSVKHEFPDSDEWSDKMDKELLDRAGKLTELFQFDLEI